MNAPRPLLPLGHPERRQPPRDTVYAEVYPDPEPHTGRRLVTVAEWNARPDELVDEYAYWYNPTDAEFGLDPWRLVDGIDPPAEPQPGDLYDVWFASGHSKACTPDAFLYVSAPHYPLLRKPE